MPGLVKVDTENQSATDELRKNEFVSHDYDEPKVIVEIEPLPWDDEE